MSESVHHIRLLAGLEIEPSDQPSRMLDRHQAERLAGHLADDLYRVVPEVERAMLVIGATVLEPFELIRPGFPAWRGLEDLSETTLHERGFGPRILAIGAHAGKMPQTDLQPPDAAPRGRFVALPMLLICAEDDATSLRQALEDRLFEKGSIDPPARALLSDDAGLDSVHGQLLTLADLIALQHVQLDGAGLGGFWPVVELSLTDPDSAREHALPGGLEARWRPDGECVELEFLSFDQCAGTADGYALWLRAFRTLTTLLDTHAIAWQALATDPVVFDSDNGTMIESVGAVDHPDGLTVQHHADVGLLAWTLVEDGRMMHIYPLRPESADRVMGDLAARGVNRFDSRPTLHVHPETGRLRPAQP